MEDRRSPSPVRLLMINASPRAHGNTAYLAEEALKILPELAFPVEAKTYSFAGKRFSPCIGCLKCYENGGQCVWKDDFHDLRQLWLEADCVVYALPVYVVGAPGQLKCFLDRLHNAFLGYFPVTSMRHMKSIGAITQGGDFGGGQELAALDIMRHAALINGMYTAPDGSYVNSSGWADGDAGVELKKKAERGAPDYDITIATARSIVKRTAELALVIRSGVAAQAELLRQDRRYQVILERTAK